MCFYTVKTYATVDELILKDNEAFYFIVRATNTLGYSYSLRSNGITVKLEALIPGAVKDGSIFGKDLNYQFSITSLSAWWQGFGADNNELKKKETVTNGKNAYYEYICRIHEFLHLRKY